MEILFTYSGQRKFKEFLLGNKINMTQIAIGTGIQLPTYNVLALAKEKDKRIADISNPPYINTITTLTASFPISEDMIITEIGVLDDCCDLLIYGNCNYSKKGGETLDIVVSFMLSPNGEVEILVTSDSATINDLNSAILTHENSINAHEPATASLNGFISVEDRQKLLGIPELKINNQVMQSGLVEVEMINGYIIPPFDLRFPSDAKTIGGECDLLMYNHTHPSATHNLSGFLDKKDKVKLTKIERNAEVNPLDFSKIMVNGKAIIPERIDDTLELVGNGVDINVSSRKIVLNTNVSVDDGNARTLSGRSITDFTSITHIGTMGERVHRPASLSEAGFMTIDSVSKLNSIQQGAKVNPKAFSKIRVNKKYISAHNIPLLEINNGPNISVTLTDKLGISKDNNCLSLYSYTSDKLVSESEFQEHPLFQHAVATQNDSGLMSNTSKVKLEALYNINAITLKKNNASVYAVEEDFLNHCESVDHIQVSDTSGLMTIEAKNMLDSTTSISSDPSVPLVKEGMNISLNLGLNYDSNFVPVNATGISLKQYDDTIVGISGLDNAVLAMGNRSYSYMPVTVIGITKVETKNIDFNLGSPLIVSEGEVRQANPQKNTILGIAISVKAIEESDRYYHSILVK